MGNKLGRRRQVVDERYTRPQGLFVDKDVDIKKLRKLILESKLAPCYPGDEECRCDFEECPICFLYYPSLNRSRCCTKRICTECFLQMKNPNSTRPTQCPFCKTTNYAVEYRGVKTQEEKGTEQIEEQRVIEAKIRMRQQERQDEEERMQRRQEVDSPRTSVAPGEVEYNPAVRFSRSVEGEGNISFWGQGALPLMRQPAHPRANWDDLDLDDIMFKAAIRLSQQETGGQRNPTHDAAFSEHYVSEDRYISPTMVPPIVGSSSSLYSGLACAIAALAERQQMGGESSINHSENMPSSFNMLPGSGRLYDRVDQDENYPPAESLINSSFDGQMTMARDEGDWGVDCGSEVAEAGTSYASSEVAEDGGRIPVLTASDEIGGNFQNVPGSIIPESFEEQMRLAMAISLAEARSMRSGSEVSWQ